MQFMEFLEAICRVIEKSSPAPPIGEDADSDEEEMSLEDRKAQSLRDKIRNSIPLLAQNCGPWFYKYFKQL